MGARGRGADPATQATQGTKTSANGQALAQGNIEIPSNAKRTIATTKQVEKKEDNVHPTEHQWAGQKSTDKERKRKSRERGPRAW
jgi:hypothetical protein